MRRDELYLQDIIDAADAIDRFVGGVTEEQFLDDELRQSAVLQKLMIMGESAARISSELKDRHADIAWRDIIAFRNFAVHAYFAVDWHIVWYTAMHDAPLLRNKIAEILKTL